MRDSIEELYQSDMMSLVEKAHKVHCDHFDPREIQKSHLISIKTGGCPENCAYCPQSAHYQTTVKKQPLMQVDEIKQSALQAKQRGASRFCMGAAWREVRDGEEFDQVLEAVTEVKKIGLEVCCTLGMLSREQADKLKTAGLHAYNHNIDTSDKYYKEIISTREFKDRLQTIQNVRDAGITVCTGGILGMGESDDDRIAFIQALTDLSPSPESITINTLVRVAGTPLENTEPIDPLIIVRVIAICRILMPNAMIRLSAGRLERSSLEQFLCFYVGANSVFIGDKLLTSPNPQVSSDEKMFEELGLNKNANTPTH